MWVYFFNVITIPIYYKIIKNKKLFVFLVCLQLFLILALRSSYLGVDLPNYGDGFEYIKGLDFGDLISRLSFFHTADLIYPYNYESGYTLFNWLTSHLGLNFHGFLVLCAAINVGSVGCFIYKYSKNPWLSFVIFSTFGFFAYDFGIIRQSLALSMILLSYIFFDKHKKITGLLSFVLAFSFHRTAIIALPLLLLSRVGTITRKKYLILSLLSLLLLLLSGIIYHGVVEKLMFAMGKGYIGHEAMTNNMIIFLIIILIIVFIFYNFSKIKDRIDSVACYALIFSVYFSIFGMYNETLARALQFYSVFLIILIPAVFSQYRNQKMTLLIEIAVYLLLLGFMYYNLNGSYIDPYVFNNEGFLWD